MGIFNGNMLGQLFDIEYISIHVRQSDGFKGPAYIASHVGGCWDFQECIKLRYLKECSTRSRRFKFFVTFEGWQSLKTYEKLKLVASLLIADWSDVNSTRTITTLGYIYG